MADVAELGFSVDTDPLKAANDQLERMPKTAGDAEKATTKFNAATDKGTSATAKFSKMVETAADGIKENFVDAMKMAVAAFAGFFALERVWENIKETADQIDVLSKAARAVGSSFASFQAVQVAGELAGLAAEDVDAATKRMSKAIGLAVATGKGASGAFKDLGISAQKLAAMPVDQRMAAIADKIKGLGLNSAATTALLSKLGDRTGALTNLMQEGGDSFRDAAALVKQFNLGLSDAAGLGVEKLMDAFLKLGFAIKGAFIQTIAAAAPIITPFIELLANGIAALVHNFSILQPILTQAAISMAIFIGPQVIAGIGSLVVGIGRATIAMLGFDAAADANPIGLIISAIGILILLIYNFRDVIQKVFGIDVTAVMEDSVNFMVKIFETGWLQMQFAVTGLPQVIGAAMRGAVNFVITGINAMIGTAIGGINTLIDKIKSLPIIGGAMSGIGGLDPKTGQIPTIGNSQGATDWAGLTGAGKALADYNKQAADIMKSDPIGDLTKAWKGLTTAATTGAGALGSGAGDLTGLGNAGKGAADKLASLKKAYNDIVLSAQNKIAQNRNDIASLGQSAEQTEYLAEKQDLLNQALKAGIALTPDQASQLDNLARTEAQTAAQAKALTDVYNEGKSVFTGFFTGLAQDIEQGKDLWTSLADVATKALDDILNKAIEMMANSAFDSIWTGGGASGGGIGGFISGLLGIGGGGATGGLGMGDNGVIGGFAKGGVFGGGISAHSNSVVSRPTLFKFAAGSTGLMGEAGPEAILPLSKGRNGKLGVAMNSDGSGGGSVVMLQPIINNNVSDQVNATASVDNQGQLVVMIDKVVSDRIANPSSKTHKAMKSTFGVSQATKAR